MKNVMKRRLYVVAILFTIHCSIFVSHAVAQTEPEYRLELGGGVGLVSYQGDFNSNPLKNQQPMFSVLAKYRFDPRMALAMNVSYGWLKGTATADKTYYPNLTEHTFKNSVVDVGFRLEYNFWPFGTGMEYRGAQRLTPYIYIGEISLLNLQFF